MTADDRPLYAPCTIGPFTLRNRIVMAPMTRNRAPGAVPNALMARYYRQRASAGLIITEGTSPSPNGLGYARIPGIFSRDQAEGWKGVTAAVHEEGGTIFCQLMHTGRIGHPKNLPPGARLLAPSAVTAQGSIHAGSEGRVPFPPPHVMTEEDIREALREYDRACTNAIEAGFDGVELHGANGYLIEEFLRPSTNRRTDAYGGAIEQRARFALEAAATAAKAIGRGHVGMRLSPFGVTNDMHDHEGMEQEYRYLAEELGRLGILYLHLVDPGATRGAPRLTDVTRTMRRVFPGAVILCGGYDAARAEADVAAGRADLIAAARPFLANPDLPARWSRGLALATPDRATFYTDGEAGYTDYPAAT